VIVLIVCIVAVVLAPVVLGAIAYGLLGAAGRLRREMEAAERDVAPLVEQLQAASAAAEARGQARPQS
jgi:Sec-independent protein translocase protein TatA